MEQAGGQCHGGGSPDPAAFYHGSSCVFLDGKSAADTVDRL